MSVRGTSQLRVRIIVNTSESASDRSRMQRERDLYIRLCEGRIHSRQIRGGCRTEALDERKRRSTFQPAVRQGVPNTAERLIADYCIRSNMAGRLAVDNQSSSDSDDSDSLDDSSGSRPSRSFRNLLLSAEDAKVLFTSSSLTNKRSWY